jgi:hypothetical protein
MEPSQDIRVGDLVTVEGDRGKDLGKVISNSVTLAEVRAFQRQQMERAGCAQASGPEDVRPTGAVAATGQKEILLKMLYKKAQQDPDARFVDFRSVRDSLLIGTLASWSRKYKMSSRRCNFSKKKFVRGSCL